MPLRLAIHITTKPGHAQDQVDAFTALAPVVRAEPGCLQYDLHSVDGEPERFVLLEAWESQDALDAHDASSHMARADAANKAFRAGPAEVLRLSFDPVA